MKIIRIFFADFFERIYTQVFKPNTRIVTFKAESDFLLRYFIH